MPFDRFKHKRRSIRLPGYDYSSPGVYFITIDTHRSMHFFGEIVDGEMRLNEWGAIANAEWLRSADLRREIELDEFQIMPNHMHGIIIITDGNNGFVGARRRRAPTDAEPNIVIPTRRAPTDTEPNIVIPTRRAPTDTEPNIVIPTHRAPTDAEPNGEPVPIIIPTGRAPTHVERFGKPVPGSIPTIVRAYKSAVTYRINQSRGTSGAALWQRNYYEHIIRDENELIRIREYIRNNPFRWDMDPRNR